jgi:hypothetical protein
MPHPERACETAVGSTDGLLLFRSVARALASGREPQGVRVIAADSRQRVAG